ncbi:MAG: putative lipopolysaccharide heptosyltransferase III [Gammaproteobacteria bacterium]|nr:putative lipopolysaccharide heptosyltransferase III [Gammaproteobacteria bacterium]
MNAISYPPPAEAIRRILVIKSRNIGDVLLTGPLISSLRALYPKAEITALVKAGTEEMLLDHPHLNQVIVYPTPQPNESRIGFRLRDLRWQYGLRKRQFDMVINTTEGERGALTARLSNAPIRVGWRLTRSTGWRRNLLTHPQDPREGKRHTVIRNLDLLGIPPEDQDRRVRLQFADADLTRVDTLLRVNGRQEDRPLAWIHPASRWFFKCWTAEGMSAVIEHLGKRGFDVVLTSGPDHRERYQVRSIRDLCRCPSGPIDLSGRLTLKETAALAHRADLFFGVDTAPMHIAAAMDIPVVALFGPSGTFDWGPWPNDWAGSDTPYPLQHGVQHAGPHTVIQKAWACVPCGKDGCNGSKKSQCLDEMSPEEVIPRLDAVINKIQVGHNA